MKENTEFKPAKLRLKIDLVSYHARAEGLVNIDKQVKQCIHEPFISDIYEGRSINIMIF